VRGESSGSAIISTSIPLPSGMEGSVGVMGWEVDASWDTGVSGEVSSWKGTNDCSPPRGTVPLSDSSSNETESVSSVSDPRFLRRLWVNRAMANLIPPGLAGGIPTAASHCLLHSFLALFFSALVRRAGPT
jgi:hypothetical protein